MLNWTNPSTVEASTSSSPAPSTIGNNAPKYGTLVPNRVFVGGISASTTEQDLLELFSKYGTVKATKVISDRAGVSKGYGFVTFETEEEARRLTLEGDEIMLKDRKLNIAPAIKKQVSDIGYIKPYSPRLVDGPGAVISNSSGVFFGNGVSYTYGNTVPVLTSHADYQAAVVTAPTFPQQAHPQPAAAVPVTAAAATAAGSATATQIAAAPTASVAAAAAAYQPTAYVYHQPVFFPQQYPQYQPTQAIQTQWGAAPQWRWYTPTSYAQPVAGYITSDGIYTQAAPTYIVPDRSC